MREVIATGKTVEEATEAGCSELGLGRHEVSVEILEMPVKKLFKSTPAKVRVTADDGQEPQKKAEAAPAQPKPAAPVNTQKPAQGQAAAQPQAAPDERQLLPEEPEEAIDLEQAPHVKKAVDYLLSILNAAGAGQVQVNAIRQGDATLFRVEDGEIASKMEIRGETIQALSYLIDRSVNAGVDKKDPNYLRIRLDIAGYRNRREGELVSLASRTAKEVAHTGRSKTLAPMNPYERLIVHTAVSKIEGVTSESIGSDVERRVVVKSTGPNATDGEDWHPPRKGGSGGGGSRVGRPSGGNNYRGGNRGGGGGGGRDRDRNNDRNRSGRGGPPRDRASSTPEREDADRQRDPDAKPVVPQRRDAIQDGEDLPLYGKIEL